MQFGAAIPNLAERKTSSGGLNYRKRESFSKKTEQEETEVSTIKFEIDGK